MFKEHDLIVLTSDIPQKGLKSGDVGTIVHVHTDDQAYVVEFTTLEGDTAAIATVLPSQARTITGRDITHSRLLETA